MFADAGIMYTTRDVINLFYLVPGPGRGLEQKFSFLTSLKTQDSGSFGKNEFTHDDLHNSKYKIMQKSPVQKFCFSNTLIRNAEAYDLYALTIGLLSTESNFHYLC